MSLPYLIATYSKTPVQGQNTSIKDWGKSGKWAVKETVYFEDKIKTKHMTEAHVIIDLINMKIIKSRFDDDSEEETIDYYLSKYSSRIQQAIYKWIKKGNTLTPEQGDLLKTRLDDMINGNEVS